MISHSFSFFFFNDTATTEIYTLSLHDALPISVERNIRDAGQVVRPRKQAGCCAVVSTGKGQALQAIRRKRDDVNAVAVIVEDRKSTRLNSSHLVISYAVFCLKKKK